MLRIFAFVLVLIVTAAPAPLHAQQTPIQRPGPFLIYGPVHTIRDERTVFKKENGAFIEGPKVLIHTLEYNEDGTKQDGTYYSPDGKDIRRTVDTYDPDGRILETNIFQGGILDSRIVRRYDNLKQLIEQVTYRGDGSVEDRVVDRKSVV